MSDMDDLRTLTQSDDVVDNDPLAFELGPEIDQSQQAQQPFLGLTPAQRAFLAFMLFLNVLVIGIGLLVATNRLSF
jgi:hypothetical protein